MLRRRTWKRYNRLFAYAYNELKALQTERRKLIRSIRSALYTDRETKLEKYGTVQRANGSINVQATALIERIEGDIVPVDQPAVDYVKRLNLYTEESLKSFAGLIIFGADHLRDLAKEWTRQADSIIFDDHLTKSRVLTSNADYQYIDDVLHALESGQLPDHSVYQLIESTKPIYQKLTRKAA